MKVVVAVGSKTDTLFDFIRNHDWGTAVQFRLVHVIDVNAGVLHGYYSSPHLVDSIMSYAHEVTDFARSRIEADFPNAQVSVATPTGHPAELLLLEAEACGADAIVMATESRGIIGRIFLGSTTLAVLSHATCAVIIVAAGGQRPEAAAA